MTKKQYVLIIYVKIYFFILEEKEVGYESKVFAEPDLEDWKSWGKWNFEFQFLDVIRKATSFYLDSKFPVTETSRGIIDFISLERIWHGGRKMQLWSKRDRETQTAY